MKKIQALLNDTKGAGMVEYILLVGVVALLCISAFRVFGEDVSGKIEEQGDAVGAINAAE